jgi:hypothetical protein
MSRKFRLLTSLISAFFMAAAISFIMVAVNIGFIPNFIFAWLKAGQLDT